MLRHNIFALGLDKYEFAQDLRFCAKDCTLVVETLGGLASATVHEAHAITRDAKTAFSDADFISMLERIVALPATLDDTIILYFAGHGFERNGRDYLAMSNTDMATAAHAVPVDQVVATLRQTKARFALLIVDACRITSSRGLMRFGEDTRSVSLKQGIIAVLGCSPGEVCWESADLGESGHGLFTYSFAQLIREEGNFVPAVAEPRLRERVHAECARFGYPVQSPEIASSTVSNYALDLLSGAEVPLAPRPKRLLLLAGPPNAGKSTIGAMVSKALGFTPTEMSSYAYARLRAARDQDGYVGTMQQFMEDVVWRDREYDAIAKDLLASQSGVSELVVGGPRRTEEVETLRASGFEVVPFYLYSSSDTRYRRHVVASDAERRQNVGLREFIERDFIENSWGLPMIGRMAECSFVNNVQNEVEVAAREIAETIARRGWATGT